MTEQAKPKLSKAQAAVIERMQKGSWWREWWDYNSLRCYQSTVDALVRRGILEADYSNFRWRLVPEAERVPVADLDIPF